MATLINIPHEVQDYISNYLRPHKRTEGNVADEVKIDPFSKAKDVANIKCIHRNVQDVLLWKNHAWKERIRQWRDEHWTKMRWVYKYGTLPKAMIQKGWESKINNIYRHQGCYVETMIGTAPPGEGEYLSEVECEYKVILFGVSLLDLITGIRPLPHCFGSSPSKNSDRSINGTFQLTQHFVPAPSLNTMIPKDERRKWLHECFAECVLEHWGNLIVEKNGGKKDEKLDFIKEFKKIMELPSDYELTQSQLYRMFLKELLVRREYLDCSNSLLGIDGKSHDFGHRWSTETIDDICCGHVSI